MRCSDSAELVCLSWSALTRPMDEGLSIPDTLVRRRVAWARRLGITWV